MSRLKIVRVSDAFLAHIFRHGTRTAHVTTDPLPQDAQLVAIHFDGRTFSLTYRSDEFEEVPDGELIPLLEPKFAMGPAPDA